MHVRPHASQVGDQLIRVNGYAVDDAVHRELSQYVACQDRLTLKVRGKQRNNDNHAHHEHNAHSHTRFAHTMPTTSNHAAMMMCNDNVNYRLYD